MIDDADDAELAEAMIALQEARTELRRGLEKIRDDLAKDGLILDVDAAYAAMTSDGVDINDFISRPDDPSARH